MTLRGNYGGCALAGVLLMTLMPVSTAAQQPRLAAGYWTRGLSAGWGHAWRYGVPGYGKTESDVRFAAFHPQLGRFVTDHLELHGEGTLLLYDQPARAAGGGLAGLGGRYHVCGTGHGRRTSPGGRGCSGRRSTCPRSTAPSTSSSSTVWAFGPSRGGGPA